MKENKSIVIVEDEVEIGSYLKDLLEPLYSEVVYFNSALEAQENLRSRTYSLVMSDIKMPGLPGHELVEFLRSIGRIEPVVFITGHATHEVLLTAVRLGVSDVIEKPFDEVTLLESIQRIFEIEKRRFELYEAQSGQDKLASSDHQKKKMIGLLQVVNSRKKSNY
ncbi:MAG: response regulator [Bdellovibrio sp.]|jgi:DNA-binding NtrC family response regulator